MEFLRSTFTMIGWMLEFGFALWPAIVLAPLGWRRGKVLPAMMALWFAMLVGWLVARASTATPASFLIPEPTNTYIFFLTGPVLIVANLAATLLRRGGT